MIICNLINKLVSGKIKNIVFGFKNKIIGENAKNRELEEYYPTLNIN